MYNCISAFLCILYEYRPLCISYLLKSKGYVFWPTGRAGWAKFFFTLHDRIKDSANYSALFSRVWVQNRFLPRRHTLILFRIAWRIFMSSVPAVFSPTNKMYLICSKKTENISPLLTLWQSCVATRIFLSWRENMMGCSRENNRVGLWCVGVY